MDPRLLEYYNRELQHIREMGAEFAKQFPKVAGRLDLDSAEVADPYVERLLEGFAFLAARVQLKIDAEYPQFTQHLMEMVYPHYLAPKPSMAVAEFQPDLTEGALAEGFVVPRDTVLRAVPGSYERTPCEYRTAHDVTLWPLQIVEAKYLSAGVAQQVNVARLPDVRAGIRLRLKTTGEMAFNNLSMDELPLYLRASRISAMRLYEQLHGNTVAMVVRPPGAAPPWQAVLDKHPIRRLGFEDSEALFPYTRRSFQGYRLLHEYFAFPERYLFANLIGIGPSVKRCEGSELEITLLLNRGDTALEDAVTASDFALFCSPAINVFPKRADRIHVNERQSEFHVVPDRTRPLDFEVYGVTGVEGIGQGQEQQQVFRPFYGLQDLANDREGQAYYTLRRAPRVLSSQERRAGRRSDYVGNEAFLSIVDASEAPYSTDLRQLAVATLCTNRDLPLHLSFGGGKTDFTLEIGGPVEAVRCLAGPTKPRPSSAQGERAWRLVSHLSLNYLSLADSDEDTGAAALRELLMLYGDMGEAPVRKQIEGLLRVRARPVTRRVPGAGPITFGRGLEVAITCDETAFEGSGVFLLGAVLERFFSKYVSINSFTETVVETEDRGEIMRWPVTIGQRRTL